jgi:hypothetical protein
MIQPVNHAYMVQIRKRAIRAELEWAYELKKGELEKLARLLPSSVGECLKLGVFGSAVSVDLNGAASIQVYVNESGAYYAWERLIPACAPILDRTRITAIVVDQFSWSNLARFRPCGGGCSIGPRYSGTTGTLGAWIMLKGSGQILGISNNHVLADYNRGSIGDEVIQPGSGDGGKYSDVIGALTGFVPLKPFNPSDIDQCVNSCDLAWMQPHDSSLVDRSIGNSGTLPASEAKIVESFTSDSAPTNPDLQVWMCGRTSGKASGIVSAVAATVFIKDHYGTEYMFEDQIHIDMPNCGQGDSGSLVLDQNNRIVGLMFAITASRSGKKAIVTPWNLVVATSGLTFKYT